MMRIAENLLQFLAPDTSERAKTDRQKIASPLTALVLSLALALSLPDDRARPLPALLEREGDSALANPPFRGRLG